MPNSGASEERLSRQAALKRYQFPLRATPHQNAAFKGGYSCGIVSAVLEAA